MTSHSPTLSLRLLFLSALLLLLPPLAHSPIFSTPSISPNPYSFFTSPNPILHHKVDYSFNSRTVSKPRVYSDFNAYRPKEYWDYDSLALHWSDQENYEVIRKVGRGKYSEIFEGINVHSKGRCMIKILKPVKKKKLGHRQDMLSDTFWLTTFFEYVSSLGSQMLVNWLVCNGDERNVQLPLTVAVFMALSSIIIVLRGYTEESRQAGLKEYRASICAYFLGGRIFAVSITWLLLFFWMV